MCFLMKGRFQTDTHQLVAVPVQSRLLQHKPVLLPFDTQEAFALFLPVQPALVVWLPQLLHRDSSPAHCAIAYTHECTEGSFCVHRKAKPQPSGGVSSETPVLITFPFHAVFWSIGEKNPCNIQDPSNQKCYARSAYLFAYESASHDINITAQVFFSEQSQTLRSFS